MTNKYFVFLRDNKLFIRIKGQENILEYSFENLGSYPNVPFYSCIIEDAKAVKKVSGLVKGSLIGVNAISRVLMKPIVFWLVPDDAMEIDKRFLYEFMAASFSAAKVHSAYECMFVGEKGETDYICVSQSCRMTILTYIKDNAIHMQKFIENRDFSMEELKKLICELHPDCKTGKLNVYLNGSHLRGWSAIGKVVEQDRLIDSFYNILKELKLSPIK